MEFARNLVVEQLQPKTPGRDLLQFAGAIPPADLALMEGVIENECERVDLREWE